MKKRQSKVSSYLLYLLDSRLGECLKRIPPPRCVNFLLKTKAFTLIEVMIAMSVLSLLGYFMADMIVNQQKSISGSESRMEDLEVFRQIQSILTDKAACERTLAGNSIISPARAATQIDIDSTGGYDKKEINSIRDKSDRVVFQKNSTYGNNSIKVTELSIQNQSVSSSGGTGTAYLSFTTERLKGNLKGKTVTRKLLLQIETDAAGEISTCFAGTALIEDTAKLEALKLFLEMNGCTYDPVTETVSCDPISFINCSVSDSSCSVGSSLAGTTKTNRNVCCKDTVPPIEKTCNTMGGTYEPDTCPSTLQRFTQVKKEITPLPSSVYGCPTMLDITTESCPTGYIAMNFNDSFESTQGYFNSRLRKIKFRTVPTRARPQGQYYSGRHYKVKICEYSKNGKRTPKTFGTAYSSLKYKYTINCISSQALQCQERCEIDSKSHLMRRSRENMCKTLESTYDPVKNRCVALSSRLKTLESNSPRCTYSDSPCKDGELQVTLPEKWRGCFYTARSLKVPNTPENMQTCHNSSYESISSQKAQLDIAWKCDYTGDCSNISNAKVNCVPGFTPEGKVSEIGSTMIKKCLENLQPSYGTPTNYTCHWKISRSPTAKKNFHCGLHSYQQDVTVLLPSFTADMFHPTKVFYRCCK